MDNFDYLENQYDQSYDDLEEEDLVQFFEPEEDGDYEE